MPDSTVAIESTGHYLKKEKQRLLKKHLMLSAVLIIAGLIFVRVLYHFDVEMKQQRFVHVENTFLQVQKTFTGYGLLSVVNDLGVMIGHQHSAVENQLSSTDYQSEFRKEMVLLCQNRLNYRQISIFDLNGQETLKIECDEGRPTVVHADMLSTIAGSSLYRKVTQLHPGDVFISDTPYETDISRLGPVTRIITPFTLDHTVSGSGSVHDSDGGTSATQSASGVGTVRILEAEPLNEHSHEVSSFMQISYTGSNVHSLISEAAIQARFTPQGGSLLVINHAGQIVDSSHARFPIGSDAADILGVDIASLHASQGGHVEIEDGTLFYSSFSPIEMAAELSPDSRNELISNFVADGDMRWLLMSYVESDMLPYSDRNFLLKSWALIPATLMLVWLVFYMMFRQQMQRRISQARIEFQSRLLENVLASMVDSVVTTDRHGHIVQANRAAQELIGLTEQQIVEADVHSIQEHLDLGARGRPDGMAQWLNQFNHQNKALIEGKVVTVTGEMIPVEVSINRSRGGDEARYLWVIRNISERKEAENEIENLHRKYIHREKLAEAGLLSGGILHEVSNPLAAIQGMLANMVFIDDHRNEPALNQETRQTISSISEHVDRIRNISREVSSFLRPTGSQKVLSDLNGLLTTTTDLLRFDRRWQNVDLCMDLDTSICAIKVVPDQIIQVALNLISNACDAALTGPSETPQVRVRSWMTEDSLCFAVYDNGIGMDDDTKKRIFNPFFTTKGERGGTGLGLPLVAGIIQDHDGKLTIDSEVGQGTAATCCLPI